MEEQEIMSLKWQRNHPGEHKGPYSKVPHKVANEARARIRRGERGLEGERLGAERGTGPRNRNMPSQS